MSLNGDIAWQRDLRDAIEDLERGCNAVSSMPAIRRDTLVNVRRRLRELEAELEKRTKASAKVVAKLTIEAEEMGRKYRAEEMRVRDLEAIKRDLEAQWRGHVESCILYVRAAKESA